MTPTPHSLADTQDEVTNKIKFAESLYHLPISTRLQRYLDTFKQSPLNPSFERFIEGVEQFTKIANLNPTQKKEFYGSEL